MNNTRRKGFAIDPKIVKMQMLQASWRIHQKDAHPEDQMSLSDYIEENPELLKDSEYIWDSREYRLIHR